MNTNNVNPRARAVLAESVCNPVSRFLGFDPEKCLLLIRQSRGVWAHHLLQITFYVQEDRFYANLGRREIYCGRIIASSFHILLDIYIRLSNYALGFTSLVGSLVNRSVLCSNPFTTNIIL